MVLLEQIAALLDYLETQPELALGHLSRTNEGRSLAKRLWEECANTLNSVTPDCPHKSPAEWRLFFNEYKSKVTKKIKMQKREISATGGGPAKKITLTPLQERLYDLLGRDLGEPLAGVRHNPLSNIGLTQRTINVEQNITLPAVKSVEVDVCASASTSEANNSISILDNYHEGYEALVVPNVGNVGTSQIISLEQENVDPLSPQPIPPPSNQPPRRRRQRVQRHYPTEDRDQTALEASQARLERIEGRNAEATIELARATNNLASALHNLGGIADEASNRLAAALERIGDRLSIPPASIN